MKGIITSIALSTIALAGCAHGEKDHDSTATNLLCPEGSAYNFRVQADVDACDVEGLHSALEKWNHEMRDAFPFTVTINPSLDRELASCVVHVYNDYGPGDAYYAWASSHWNTNTKKLATGSIMIRVNSIGKNARHNQEFCTSLMLHETGHLLGLDHDTSQDHSSIMAPGLISSGTMGCEDVRRACKIWGCTPRCIGNGWVP